MFGWWYIIFGLIALMVVAIVLKKVACEKCWFDLEFASLVVFCVAGILAIVMLMPVIVVPIEAKKDVERFKHQKIYVESAIENGDILENISVTNTIIEQNLWLADAKARLEAYGVFSVYYNTGLEELEPIVIER